MGTEREIICLDLDSDEDTNDNSEASLSDATKPCPKVTKALQKLTLKDKTKFMENFDPELSNRERRKLSRKFYAEGGRKTGQLYDDNGILISVEKDLCDCLDDHCPGCHFPCQKCRSCKCGQDCRVSRRWLYEVIENEGSKTVIKNQHCNK